MITWEVLDDLFQQALKWHHDNLPPDKVVTALADGGGGSPLSLRVSVPSMIVGPASVPIPVPMVETEAKE